jgi:hypothetical protein
VSAGELQRRGCFNDDVSRSIDRSERCRVDFGCRTGAAAHPPAFAHRQKIIGKDRAMRTISYVNLLDKLDSALVVVALVAIVVLIGSLLSLILM